MFEPLSRSKPTLFWKHQFKLIFHKSLSKTNHLIFYDQITEEKSIDPTFGFL